MADDNEPRDEDIEVLEEVEWLVDEDGTEYFVDEGYRYELGDDGYAYPVAPVGARASDAPTARDTEAGEPDPASDETTEMPRLRTAPREPDTPPDPEPSAPAAGGDGAALLELRGVRSGYGSLPVLHGVDLEIRAGETAVMLGLNGAGKSTTAKNICGVLSAWDGSIHFDGQDITKWGTGRCVNAGIVMVPEGRRVFPELSVRKNLQVGAWSQRKDAAWFEEALETVYGYFPRLRERDGQLAGTLSGGEQQMLAIGRGLMAKPKLLIVDEASMGLAPVIVHDVFEIVGQINADGTTVLMIEQNVSVLEVADAAFVMEQGRIIKRLHGNELDDLDQVSEVLMG